MAFSFMKTIFSVLITIAAVLTAPAQEISDFVVYLWGHNEVPPNNSAARGQATLSLDGNVLHFFVGIPGFALVPTAAGIYGPAPPGMNNVEIYDFGAPMSVFSPNRGSGLVYDGTLNLTESQIAEVKEGLWYVNVKSAAFPEGEIRGQIYPLTPDGDCDYDGVPNKDDLCPNTQPGRVVDGSGCSIDELVPCGGWADHKEYVKAVRDQAFRFWKEGRISVQDRNAIVQKAQNSNCPPPRPVPGF